MDTIRLQAKISAARSSLQNTKAYNACSTDIIALIVGFLLEIREFMTSTFTRSRRLASSLNFLLSRIVPNNTFNADRPKACTFGFALCKHSAGRLM